MAKSKKSTKKPTVKVQDLEPEADPKGGAEQFIKFYGPDGASALSKFGTAMNKANPAYKFDTNLALTDTNIKFHK